MHSETLSDSEPAVQMMDCLTLFNLLHIPGGLILIDSRPQADYAAFRLRQAVMPATDSGLTEAEIWLSEIRGAKPDRLVPNGSLPHIVVMSSTDVEAESQRKSAQILLASLQAIPCTLRGLSILSGGFAAFRREYPKCQCLFEGSEAPPSAIKGYPSHILPNLFLGNVRQAQDAALLQDLNIAHVVDATNEQQSKSSSASVGAKYFPVNVHDDETADLTPFFPRVAQAFADAVAGDSRLFIHCQAGVSRSSTLVFAAIMQVLKVPLRDAISLVLRQRPFACPNPAFRRQLRQLELSLFGSSSIPDDAAFIAHLRTFTKKNDAGVAAALTR